MALLSSKIVIEEEDPKVRQIQGTSTSTLAVFGITQRGPHTATQVTSFEEYTRIFGGYTTTGDTALAVQGFFEGGGQNAWVKRVVHYSDIADASTASSAAATVDLMTEAGGASAARVDAAVGNVAPYDFDPADTIVISIDGGGDLTATFDAAAAVRTAANTGPYALSNGQTLTLTVNGGSTQTITFTTGQFVDIGAATAAEVAAVINAGLTGASCDVNSNAPRITTDRKGTGAALNVTGGSANAALGFVTGSLSGTGDVADIDAVTFAEIKTRIEADVAGTLVTDLGSGRVRISTTDTGPTATIQVKTSSTAETKLGLDTALHSGATGSSVATVTVDAKTDGAYGNNLTIVVEAATNGESDYFNLLVEDDGVVKEVFANLQVADTAASDFIETVINNADTGSNLITVTDLGIGAIPAIDDYGPMTGGDDGLTSLADSDFTGSSVSKTGVHGFDETADLNLLICPDRATAAVHVKMLSYCETTRSGSMFAILECPEGLTTAQMITYVETTAGLMNLSEYGAIYYPRIKVLNPSSSVFGTESTLTVPNSGHIAGCYARTDNARIGGVYDAPAGIERGRLLGVVGFETTETAEEAKRDLLYPKRINPLAPVAGIRCIDGSRTLKGNGNFPSVSERRGVIFIQQSLKSGLEFARHKNNDDALRAAVARTIRLFLLSQMNVGAFRSRVPDEAFFVDAGRGLNTDAVILAGQLIVRIGLATQKPADFIILRFSQDTRALDTALQG